MIKCCFLLAVGLLITMPGQTQSFRMRANVGPVASSGYYRVQLLPDVVGRLNADLTDIRLYDEQQREVAYLLTRESPKPASNFVAYPELSRTVVPRVATTLVLRNPAKQAINSLTLLIKNTNLTKKARLSGSTDARNWFGIDDDVWIAPTNSERSTTAMRQLDFPLSDYGYYRLEINDSLTAPLNVLQVGYYTKKAGEGSYDPVSGLIATQEDNGSEHRTYLKLSRNTPARIDKLQFTIRAPAQFRRRAVLGYLSSRRQKRGQTRLVFEPVYSLELNSSGNNTVLVNGLTTNNLCVVVENEDNIPLTFGPVRAGQQTTFLTANLTVGTTYRLWFSAGTVAAPAYDIAYFQKTLATSLTILRVTNIRPANAPAGNTWGLLTPRWFIWIGLGLVLALLAYFSMRMLRDMNRNQTV